MFDNPITIIPSMDSNKSFISFSPYFETKTGPGGGTFLNNVTDLNLALKDQTYNSQD